MKKTFYKVMVIDADGTVTVLRDATTLGDIPNIVESDILERGRIAEANANADGIEKVREQTNGEIVTAKIYYAARPSTEPLPLPNGRIYQVEEVMQSPAPFGDSRDASSIDQELSDPASMEFLCAQVGGLSIYVYPDESRHRGRPHCTVAVFPSAEAYCGATPTELRPFFGSAVSSMINQALSPPTNLSASTKSAASSGAASQTLLPIK